LANVRGLHSETDEEAGESRATQGGFPG